MLLSPVLFDGLILRGEVSVFVVGQKKAYPQGLKPSLLLPYETQG
jgi:hypothetical protein